MRASGKASFASQFRGDWSGERPKTFAPSFRSAFEVEFHLKLQSVEYRISLNSKSYRTHGTIENKIKIFTSRFSIFYDSMSSDCDLCHAPSFQKLKAELFISVSLCLLLFAFGA